MHLTLDNTFTVHYIKHFSPYWQFSVAIILIWTSVLSNIQAVKMM